MLRGELSQNFAIKLFDTQVNPRKIEYFIADIFVLNRFINKIDKICTLCIFDPL